MAHQNYLEHPDNLQIKLQNWEHHPILSESESLDETLGIWILKVAQVILICSQKEESLYSKRLQKNDDIVFKEQQI